jgi:hypothetical protein
MRMNDSHTKTWPVLPAAVSDVPVRVDDVPEPMVTVVVPPDAPAPAAAGLAPTAMARRPKASSDVWATRATKAMAVVTVPISTR